MENCAFGGAHSAFHRFIRHYRLRLSIDESFCPGCGEGDVKILCAAMVHLLALATARAEVTANDPLPARILTCGGSIITEIGPRLEGDANFSSGTSVFYRNRGAQVSYEKEPAIIKSKKGDHVLICLVFIPENCPPGDNRGKIYTTTNLRTLESWTLPDSEHMCGGA